jgi:hypothetical protein
MKVQADGQERSREGGRNEVDGEAEKLLNARSASLYMHMDILC